MLNPPPLTATYQGQEYPLFTVPIDGTTRQLILVEKGRKGIVRLRGPAEAVASIFLALGDGLEVQLTSDPAWDDSHTVASGVAVARFLLGAED